MFGDNKSVVTSSTVPHSLLSKGHNILSYHRVREAIAAKILVFHWCDSFQNKSDILSKHWEFSKVFHIIRDLFDFQGKISLIQSKNTSLAFWTQLFFLYFKQMSRALLDIQPDAYKHVEKLQFSFYLDLLFSEIYDSLGSFVVFPKDCLFTCIFHSLQELLQTI